jgi:hypothetical protein
VLLESLEDVVRFDIKRDRAALCARLQEHHLVWLEPDGQADWVCVALRPDDAELAVVLRTVQEWAAEYELAGVLFELDGRQYVVRGLNAPATLC